MFHSSKINKQSGESLIKGNTEFTNTASEGRGNCESSAAEFKG